MYYVRQHMVMAIFFKIVDHTATYKYSTEQDTVVDAPRAHMHVTLLFSIFFLHKQSQNGDKNIVLKSSTTIDAYLFSYLSNQCSHAAGWHEFLRMDLCRH